MAAKQNSLIFGSFSQAFGVAVYCLTVGVILNNGEKIFPKEDNLFMPVAFLLLLSFSVLICGLLVFYKPYLLFFENKKKEAANLVVYSAAWLFAFFIAAFLFAVFI